MQYNQTIYDVVRVKKNIYTYLYNMMNVLHIALTRTTL